MSPWWAIAALAIAGALIWAASFAGYLERRRWAREYDRRHEL